ncbi:MAG: MG2 domain-containing protein [Terracidiphilus sp.]|nr:MG2 domain-containing protein [Terracidiphilus sp.]MDR3797725.1 MG2 domain-containing protein [Terracidiphilus sp.]
MNYRNLLDRKSPFAKATLCAALLVLLAAAAVAHAASGDAPRSFSLSTTRTFAPGESVKIQLLARNVPELEFRVYKVRDAEKFFSGLNDPHSFGVKPYSPTEQIDQRTWLERIHDFKAHLWWLIRSFFRGQFNDEARDNFRERQASLGKRSQVVGATQFARIPLLNESQLVARWKLVVPPALVSETQQLPIDNGNGGGLDAGVYLIEATDGTYKAYTVAIVTRIAIVERTVDGKAFLYVADRKTGAPVDQADVVLWGDGKLQSSGKTGSDGLSSLTYTVRGGAQGAEPENIWILAHHGADAAIVTPFGYGFGAQNQQQEREYIYTDRPVYRPGHTVHIKAIVRKEVNDNLVLPDEHTLTLRVSGPDNKVVFNKELPVSAHGTVAADFDLASDAALGYYNIEFAGKGVSGEDYEYQAGSGSFYVEEYKKPEYQVTVKPATPRVLQGNTIQATIEARYFFGEPVSGAKVIYVVHTSQHYWWDEDEADENSEGDASADTNDEDDTDYGYGETEQQEHQGVLDANGQLTVTLPTAVDDKHSDQDYRIEARVTDAANREVSGHSTVLATYGSFRVSVEPTSYVVENGKPARVKVTAQDYDAKPVQTQVHIAAVLTWDATSHQRSKTPVASKDATTGADGTVLVDLPLGGSGDFQVTASAETPEKRTVQGQTWVWIWNGAGAYYQENAQAQIVADKKTYQVGDVAHLLLVTGLDESWAVVTAEGDSVQSQRVLHATGTSLAFDVPITQQAQPNLVVSAIIVHNDQIVTAQKSLKVPLTERTLTITATPAKTLYEPGDKASFDVKAVDAAGKPVQADLSFGVVDEALYSVRPDTTGDIVASFYPKREVYLEPQTSFEFYFEGEAGTKSPTLAGLAGLYHPRMAQVKPGSDLVVPKVRKAFPDTAYWNADVRTGADGHAQVQFNFPDALTTWRTTIRAMTDDGKAGGAVTRVLVRKNLIVRLAAPRFFRQGDETVMRVIAHNYLATSKDVTFALDVSGVDVISGQTQKVTIPAKGESYVDWRVKAQKTGNATFTAKALTNEESDALEMTLPVLPFGVKQRAAGAGVVFSGAGQNQWAYNYPAGTDVNSRGLTITIAPSVAGTVFDALDYLTSYPWGCTEQTMSSFLPDLIVAQAVDKLHLKSPIDRKTLDDEVQAGLERLYSFQHDDGGWGWWPDDQSMVFMTAYVVSGLGQAKAAGYTVDDQRMGKAQAWLTSMLNAHPDMIPDLRAYAVYALATTSGAPKDALDKAWSSRDKLSDEGLALTGLALAAANDSRAKQAADLLEKKAHATDVDAYWVGTYDGLLDFWDDTSPETTAFALKLLLVEDRSSGLMPKAARWLAEHRDGDYWYSTKQTSMVIQGLTDYLALSGELANTSDVEVLVNGASVGKRHFGAGDAFAAPWQIKVPAAQSGNGGQVTIRKSGNGITYWSTENSWWSADRRSFQQGQLSLNITRDYYLLQKRQDKPTDPITYDLVPLNGPVHVGDMIAVRLALGGSNWKYLLAEDPIPAGAEFLPESGLYTINHKPDWWADFFTRKEFHDDRAAFFNSDFSVRREYVYLLKVDNPGKFQISPADAGPMYQPNIETTTDPATLEVQP